MARPDWPSWSRRSALPDLAPDRVFSLPRRIFHTTTTVDCGGDKLKKNLRVISSPSTVASQVRDKNRGAQRKTQNTRRGTKDYRRSDSALCLYLHIELWHPVIHSCASALFTGNIVRLVLIPSQAVKYKASRFSKSSTSGRHNI